jgi:predicted RNA-binding protein with RPS1 domain
MNELAYVQGSDASLDVTFYDKPVHLAYESNLKNMPMYDTVTYIRIFYSGGKSEVNRPVMLKNEASNYIGDDKRFPQQWANYQAGKGDKLVGTPLREWPSSLNVAQVAQLEHMNIKTVQQLAAVDDQLAGKIMGGLDMRQKARLYLQAAASQEPLSKLATENQELKQDMAMLKKQLEEVLTAQSKPANNRKSAA